MSNLSDKYATGRFSRSEYLDRKCPRVRIPGVAESICSRMDEAIREAFWMLHEILRTDQFWQNSNGLPTTYRLSKFVRKALAKGEKQSFWSLVLVALNVHYCCAPPPAKIWRSILESRILSENSVAQLLLGCSLDIYTRAGQDVSVATAAVLQELGLVNDARRVAPQLIAATGGDGWVHELLANLN